MRYINPRYLLTFYLHSGANYTDSRSDLLFGYRMMGVRTMADPIYGVKFLKQTLRQFQAILKKMKMSVSSKLSNIFDCNFYTSMTLQNTHHD